MQLLIGSVRLIKHVEDLRKLVGSDPDAIVFNPNGDLCAVVLGAQLYASSLRRILGGVAEQVHDDLGQSDLVRMQINRFPRQ